MFFLFLLFFWRWSLFCFSRFDPLFNLISFVKIFYSFYVSFTFQMLLPIIRTINLNLTLYTIVFFPVLKFIFLLNFFKLIFMCLKLFISTFISIFLDFFNNFDCLFMNFIFESFQKVFFIKVFCKLLEVLIRVIILWVFSLLFCQIKNVKSF